MTLSGVVKLIFTSGLAAWSRNDKVPTRQPALVEGPHRHQTRNRKSWRRRAVRVTDRIPNRRVAKATTIPRWPARERFRMRTRGCEIPTRFPARAVTSRSRCHACYARDLALSVPVGFDGPEGVPVGWDGGFGVSIVVGVSRPQGSSGRPIVTCDEPLVADYLEFLAGRARPNSVMAAAYDLKVFFSVVGKPPAGGHLGRCAGLHHCAAVGSGDGGHGEQRG